MNVKNRSALSELRPSGDTDQTVTVSTAVKQFGAWAEKTRAVLVTTNAAMLASFDGVDPAADHGVIIPSGYCDVWSKEMATAAKFLRSSGDVTLGGAPLA